LQRDPLPNFTDGHAVKKILLFLVFVVLAVAGFAAYDANQFLQSPLAADQHEFELTVKRGDTIRQIAARLSAENRLTRPHWLEAYARYKDIARRIKAGDYTLSSSLTPVQLLVELQSGKQKQFSQTILEGWSIWQLREALAKNEHITHTMQDVADENVMQFIGAGEGHAEGQFLPDTYLFPKGTTDVDFLLRAHKALQTKLNQLWSERQDNLPISTPYEALVLASIIEKETSVAAERELVSGVIAGRLRKGMRLQMDPTVIYGIGKTFNGNITRRDLKTPTAYNTYTIKALPPTPISMVGAASLEAAVKPAATSALYFVADGTGGHVFSDTVEEHNKAVRKYILKRP